MGKRITSIPKQEPGKMQHINGQWIRIMQKIEEGYSEAINYLRKGRIIL